MTHTEDDPIAEALAEYRRLQDAEGARLADEITIARLQGEAWRAYVALCAERGIETPKHPLSRS